MKKVLFIAQIIILCVCSAGCSSAPNFAFDGYPDVSLNSYVPNPVTDLKIYVAGECGEAGWKFGYVEAENEQGTSFLEYLYALDLSDFEEFDLRKDDRILIEDQVTAKMESGNEINVINFIRNAEGIYIYIVKHDAGKTEYIYLSGMLNALDYDALLEYVKAFM